MCNCNLHCMKPIETTYIYIWAIHNDKSIYIYIWWWCIVYVSVCDKCNWNASANVPCFSSINNSGWTKKTSTLHTSMEFWHAVSSNVKHVVVVCLISSKHQCSCKSIKLCKWYTSTNLYPSVIKRMAPHKKDKSMNLGCRTDTTPTS